MLNLQPRRLAQASILIGGLLTLSVLAAHATQAPPSYTTHIEPLFRAKCIACHNHVVRRGDLNMESYDALKTGGKRGAAFVAGKSADSLLFKMVEGRVKPRMPLLDDKLSAEEIALLKTWIDAGAPGPTTNEPAAAPTDKAVHTPDLKPAVLLNAAVSALSFAAGDSLLAVGRYREVELLHANGAGNGGSTGKLSGHANQVRALAFSPDGKLLAAAGGNPSQFGEVKLWDVAARRELRSIRGHRDNIFAVAFSPDGKTLATCSYDRLVKLWDPATGNELKTLKDHTDAVFSIAFSPDGKRLASASADRTVKIWDVVSGQRLFTLSDGLDAMNVVAFLPSGGMAGKLLAGAGADRTIRLWELGETDGRQIKSLIAHEDAITLIAFSPDGKTLASTGADKALKLWDTATLEERLTLETQPDWVFALAFSSDGKRLAAGRYDGSMAFYDPSTGIKK